MKVGRVFLSGCAVYVIVAACSAMDPGRLGGGGGGSVPVASGVGDSGGMASVGALGSGGTGGFLDPVSPASADPTSGTRLKAKSWHGTDGSIQYISGMWYDRDMMTDCMPFEASDASIRCLPAPSMPVYSDLAAYEDSQCTSMLVQQPPCTMSQRFVFDYGLSSQVACPGRVRVRELGAQVTVTSYYRRSGNSCVAQPPVSGILLRRAGDEIPPNQFVEMTLHVEP